MSATVTDGPPKRRAMELNALALMASTVFTGVLGVVFWIVAAHVLPPSAVGQASATLSAVTFLAGLAQLNIISVLLRFLPSAGRRTGRFIARAYALALGTGVVVALGFVAFGFGSEILGDEWFVPLIFIGGTMIYAIFLVQDGALTALGAAVWVPLENLLAGVLRVSLLFVLVLSSTRWGALMALVVPTAVAVAVVNWFVFRRLAPRQSAQGRRGHHRPELAFDQGRSSPATTRPASSPVASRCCRRCSSPPSSAASRRRTSTSRGSSGSPSGP